jgi:hypothetical protein
MLNVFSVVKINWFPVNVAWKSERGRADFGWRREVFYEKMELNGGKLLNDMTSVCRWDEWEVVLVLYANEISENSELKFVLNV